MKTKTIVYTLLYFLILSYPLLAQSIADSIQQAKIECDKARKYWQQQDYEKAMKHFEQAAQLDASNEDYFSNAAVCAMQLQESYRAVNNLKEAITAAIAKKQFQKIQAYNDQISMILNVWPDWAEQKYEATSTLPDNAEAIQAQQKWYELMSEIENSIDRSDPHVIQILENAIQIALKNFGDSHPQTLNSQKILAEIYMDTEQFDKALPIFSMVAESMIQPLNALHPLRISCLQGMARIYEMMEKHDQAEPLYLEAIQTSKQSMGVDHPETLMNMYFLAMMYVQQMKFKEATDLFEEMMPLYMDRLGITHPDTLACINDLANVYKQQMKTAQAESLYLSATQQQKNIYGEQSPQTIETQLELADLYRQKASFAAAESILQDAISHAQLLGEEHNHLFFHLKTELARVYEGQGRLDDAETLIQDVYEFDRKTLGEKHPNTLTDKSHMASILRKKGQLHAAEKIFEQVYIERKSISGEKDPNVIIDLNNLALVLEEQGLYEQAEPLLKKAAHLAEDILGIKHTTTLATMNNLALIHESQGVFERARPLYLKVIQTYSKRYGEDHPDTIASINNLAYLYMLEKKYDDALEKFQMVLDRWTKRLTINHQNTLKAMNNLGRVYHKKGDLEKAYQFLHQALTLRIKNFGETHIDAIRSMIDIAALYLTQNKYKPALLMIKKAIDFSTATLGPHHPYTFEALNVQAQLFQRMNNIQKACDTYALIFERRNKFFERVLWATGENARNGYIRLHQAEQDAYLTLLTMSNGSAHDILNVSLQRKGLLLKIASEIEQVTQMLDKPELNKLSQQLMDKKKKLASITLSGPAETGATNFLLEIERLENEIEELQGELGRASIRFKTTRQNISPESIVARLGEEDILLDYFIFMNHLQGKRQLVAVVAQKSESGCSDYSRVVFEDMSIIDKWIENYRTTIQDEDADEEEVKEEGFVLYEKIWQPLITLFNEKTSIYLVPDGTLNILPFDALVDDDEEYILQTYDLKILSSGRELLLTGAKSDDGTFLIIAGPDYNSEYLVETETVKDIKRKRKSRGKRNADLLKGLRMASFGMRGLSFSPLPGAEREGQEIDALCKKDRSTKLYLKNQAEEKLLRQMNHAPDILHIATHGFFLKSQENLTKRLVKLQRSMDPLKLIPPPGDNPLLRAGLAFSGINKNAQFLGEIDTDNDGVLTAIEVLGLNLFGTRLVVLSACETGLGEIHAGEGVYGLRRAFQEAGARTVINSLWEVSDQGTQRLMTALYKNILAGMPVRKAFREAQLGMKNSIMWSHPYIWSAFFMVGR